MNKYSWIFVAFAFFVVEQNANGQVQFPQVVLNPNAQAYGVGNGPDVEFSMPIAQAGQLKVQVMKKRIGPDLEMANAITQAGVASTFVQVNYGGVPADVGKTFYGKGSKWQPFWKGGFWQPVGGAQSNTFTFQ